MQLFLPMVEDEEITGTMRGESENDLVSEFVGKYNKSSVEMRLPYIKII